MTAAAQQQLPKGRLTPGSQTSRILAVLWDGRPHSVAEIHRRAGTSRLNSRISDLRRMGCEIEMTRRPGRKGAQGYVYRLVAEPATIEMPREHVEWARAQAEAQQRRDSVPRDGVHRFRLYGVRDGDVLDLLATAEDEHDLGPQILRLGRDGVLRNVCLGVLDTHGTDSHSGTWVVSPWEGR